MKEKTKDQHLKLPLAMIVSGIILVFSFFILNGVNYTGFLTLSKESITPFNFLEIIVLFISITLIINGILRLRKIEKRMKKSKKIQKLQKRNE